MSKFKQIVDLEAVRRAAMNAGIGNADIARNLGVDPSRVTQIMSQIEAGEPLTDRLAGRLARAIGVPVADIILTTAPQEARSK